MTTSPRTLLCQRQRVTSLVPSHLCRLLSTFLHRPRPGARSRAGPRRRRTPGSPSLPPASPAFLSHILPTRILSQEEAVKMEKKIRWMVMHSQVPGCFPAAAGLCCPPNNAIHATSAEAGQGERLRGREEASTGPRARYPRQEVRLGSQGPVSRGLPPWQLRACSRPHH